MRERRNERNSATREIFTNVLSRFSKRAFFDAEFDGAQSGIDGYTYFGRKTDRIKQFAENGFLRFRVKKAK